MRSLKHNFNVRGFTLVEVMIASAILMVLAVLIATMLGNLNKQQTKLEKRTSDSELLQNAALTLRLHPIPTASP